MVNASAYDLGPRALRVYTAVKERIVTGEWAVDTKIPSHTDLASTYGVAPLTVRQVLARLEQDGLVSREQGRGTFVRRPKEPAVLIVEDEPEVAELLTVHVRSAGVRPLVAHTVAEAHAILQGGHDIQLVLSDVRLPNAQDGIDLIRSIRRRHPDLPVAAVTAFPGDLIDLLGTPESPVLILPKPFRAAQVREALRMALKAG